MINSIFKNSLRNYSIYSPEDCKEIEEKIIPLYAQYEQNLLEMLKNETKKSETATIQ